MESMMMIIIIYITVEIGINLLTPKSHQYLISPYNIIPESHIKEMRIKEMITNESF